MALYIWDDEDGMEWDDLTDKIEEAGFEASVVDRDGQTRCYISEYPTYNRRGLEGRPAKVVGYKVWLEGSADSPTLQVRSERAGEAAYKAANIGNAVSVALDRASVEHSRA